MAVRHTRVDSGVTAVSHTRVDSGVTAVKGIYLLVVIYPDCIDIVHVDSTIESGDEAN